MAKRTSPFCTQWLRPRVPSVFPTGQWPRGTALGLQSYLVADRFILKPWLVQDHLQLPAVEIGYSNRLCQACIFTCFHSLQRKQRRVESHMLAGFLGACILEIGGR